MAVLRRHVALPADHGTWAFFLVPLIIGVVAGGRWHTTVLYLVVASACGFLIRQPVSLVVRVLARRRSRDVLPAAWFWIVVYGGIGTLHVVGLVLRGFGYLLVLAVPGLLVFGWYLALLYRREERRQWLLEVMAAGVMALTAPACMWAGAGTTDPTGWLLWLLVWGHSATAILYVYLRLEQRPLASAPPLGERLRAGSGPLVLAAGGVALAAFLGVDGRTPTWLVLPFLVQLAEVTRGVWRPGLGLKPTAIGLRQLAFSTVFTALFVAVWSRWSAG